MSLLAPKFLTINASDWCRVENGEQVCECGLVISEMQGQGSPWNLYQNLKTGRRLCWSPLTGDGGCLKGEEK